ncbi:MAG: sulfurtransferase TusA family protein [Actinobacteria bacterium]|nr:MAG: sulfurtransferase TusA family protein [Actinomycetota bacterium]
MDIQPDMVLDAKGLICPMPSVKTSLKLGQMEKGEVIEILTTDEASKSDLPAWAKGTGNELLKVESDKDDANVTHIFIKKIANKMR